jgi:hypothetical protein
MIRFGIGWINDNDLLLLYDTKLSFSIAICVFLIKNYHLYKTDILTIDAPLYILYLLSKYIENG